MGAGDRKILSKNITASLEKTEKQRLALPATHTSKTVSFAKVFGVPELVKNFTSF